MLQKKYRHESDLAERRKQVNETYEKDNLQMSVQLAEIKKHYDEMRLKFSHMNV